MHRLAPNPASSSNSALGPVEAAFFGRVRSGRRACSFSSSRLGRFPTLLLLAVLILVVGCGEDTVTGENPARDDPGTEVPAEPPFAVQSSDFTIEAPFGELPVRVYYPDGFTDETHVIHVSRGGNGLGDDRGGQMLPYVEAYVEEGYVVVQIDHRFAGSDIEQIAQFRGEEISFVAAEVADGRLDLGGFEGTIDADAQGFAGHSGGCMEGLQAVGTTMTHGDYRVPEIRALYGMSPAGYDPDQFGITADPVGYGGIGDPAVFVVVGEEEKNVNGPGVFKAIDWRLQAYDAMTAAGPRYEAIVEGANTDHIDVRGDNPDIEAFNIANSLVLFDTYLRGADRAAEIGTRALPPNNSISLSTKGASADPSL